MHPFPGLRPFTSEEDHLFFGREEQTAELVTRLRQSRFVAVVGTSGSGKSSLVRSGLIPALLRGRMRHAGSAWEVATMRPGGHPLQAMAEALLEADLYDPEDEDAALRLEATLGSSRHGLVEAVTQSELDPEDQFLVVVDQFEELFRFGAESARHGEEAIDFVNLLLQAAKQSERGIYVVITMRSDFLGDCAQFPGLAEAVNAGEYLIPRMTRQQCRAAIEGPAKVAGAAMSSVLLQRLLNDLGEDQDQLPILQHALMRTWDAWLNDQEACEAIELRHYESTGGMKAALSRHADEVYASLPDEAHREVARRLFQALTERGSDNRETRRPGSVKRLQAIVGGDDKETLLQRVIEAYRQPGVTFLMPGEEHDLTAETVIDISHESLMRVWKRLREWVEEEAQSARVYQRLVDTATLWEKGEAGLYHDPDLQIAQSWSETKKPNAAWAELYGGQFESAVAFLEKSHEASEEAERAAEEARKRELEQAKHLAEEQRLRVEEQKRSAKRLRWLVAGSLFIAVVAIAAFLQAQRAERIADTAKNEADRLRSQAEDAAKEMNRSLVLSDFERAAEKVAEGENKESLPLLGRAARRDPSFWQAGFRALTTMAQHSFQTRLPTLLEHEKEPVHWHAFNPKSNLVWTRERNGPEGFVWDTATGEKLYPLGDGKQADSVQFSRDGQRLFGVVENFLQGWDARTGESLGYTIDLSGSRMRDPHFLLASSENGDGALAVFFGNGWQLFDPATGAERGRRLGVEGVPALSLGFTPDGTKGCALLASGDLAIWNTADASLRRTVDLPFDLSQAPPGTWRDNRQFRESGSLMHQGENSRGSGMPLVFSADSRFLLLADQAGREVYCLNLEMEGADAKPLRWTFPEQRINGARLVTGARGDLIAFVQSAQEHEPDHSPDHRSQTLVYDLASGDEKTRIAPENLTNSRPVFPTDETLAIVGYQVNNSDLAVYNLETGEEISRTKDQTEPVAAPYFGPHGRTLFAYLGGHPRVINRGDFKRSIRSWDLFSGDTLGTIDFETTLNGETPGPAGERWIGENEPRDGALVIWDTRNGRALGRRFMAGHGLFHGEPQWSENQLIAANQISYSGREDLEIGKVAIMDVDTSVAEFRALETGHARNYFAAYNDDGSRLVIFGKRRESSDDNEHVCEIWNPHTRECLHRLTHFGALHFADFDRSGRRLAMASSKNLAFVWNLETGAIGRTFPHDAEVRMAKFSPDDQHLLTGTPRAFHLWDVDSGVEAIDPIPLSAPNTWPFDASGFSAEGDALYLASFDGKLQVVDAATGETRAEHQVVPVDERRSANAQAKYAVFSPGFDHVAMVKTRSDQVHVVRVETGEHRLIELGAAVRDVGFTADGEGLVMATGKNFFDQDANLHHWNLATGTQERAPLETNCAVTCVTSSHDGHLLAVGTAFNHTEIQIWDRQTGQLLMEPIRMGGEASAGLRFRPDGRQVVALSQSDYGRLAETVWLIDLPPSRGEVADWLVELVDTVSGERLDERGGWEDVPLENLTALREKIFALPRTDDDHAAWAQWILSNPPTRSVAPGSPKTRKQLMHRLIESSEETDLQHALKLEPGHALAHARMALFLAKEAEEKSESKTRSADERHRWDSARWYLRRALELAPEDSEILACEAVFALMEGDLDAATDAARNAMSAPGAEVNAHYVKAMTAALARDWAAAEDAFSEAMGDLSSLAASTPNEEPSSPGPPLLDILTDLEPETTWAGRREVSLPDPIAGTFEDFESVAEGNLPQGWGVETYGDDEGSATVLDLGDLASDAYRGWTVLSWERLLDAGGHADQLRVKPNQFLNGQPVYRLLQGKFLHAESRARSGSQIQILFTPDYHCAEASGVHVAFHSAYTQSHNSLALLEYSIDEGKSWLPVSYRMDAKDVFYDEEGRVDAERTFQKEYQNAARYRLAAGEPIQSTTYGEFIAAPITAEMTPFVEVGEDDHLERFKQMEVFRLPEADGQASVRLRFGHVAGNGSHHWSVDNFGLYAIAEGSEPLRQLPDRLAPTPWAPAADPDRLLDLAATILEQVESDAEGSQDEAGEGDEDGARDLARKPVKARLLTTTALERMPGDLRGLDLHAQALAWTGDLTEARSANERCLAARPQLAAFWKTRALLHERRGAELLARGETVRAGVAFEAADALERSLPGEPDETRLKRLQAFLEEADRVRKPQILIPRESTWSYLDDGSDQGTAWRAIDHDDVFWQKGQARLGYGDNAKTEVSFGGVSDQKHTTTYFRHAFELEDASGWGRLVIRLQRDDGAVVYLNGEEVARSNLPDGEVRYDTFALGTATNQDETRFFEFTAPATLLRAGHNVVAVEVHQERPDSSDLGFDLELAAEGLDLQKMPLMDELASHEEALDLSAVTRTLLWLRRAETFADSGDVTRVAQSLARAARIDPSHPGIPYARATLATAADSGLVAYWHSRVLFYQRQGSELLASGNTGQAGVCFELADALARSLPGEISAARLEHLQTLLADAGRIREPQTLISRESHWKYLDDGSDQGSDWRAIDYDDGSWPSGPARLGFGDNARTTVGYGGDEDQKHITTYFRHAFQVEEASGWGRLVIRLQRDDGAIVYLNGEEVARSNIPAEAVRFDTFALESVSNQDETRFFEFTAPATLLRTGRNVVAVEVHQINRESSDLGFDLELVANGLGIEWLPSLAQLASYEEALGIPPGMRRLLWSRRAEAFANSGDVTKAAQCRERTTEIESSHGAPLPAGGTFLMTPGDIEAAQEHFDQSLSLARDIRSSLLDDRRMGMPATLKMLTGLVDDQPLSLATMLARLPQGNALERWQTGELVDRIQTRATGEPEVQRTLIPVLTGLGRHEEALQAIEVCERALPVDWDQTLLDFREHRWVYREKQRVLNALGRGELANQARERHRYPPRPEGIDPRQLDLSTHYNGSLFDGRDWTNSEDNNLSGLTEGLEPRHGIEFDTRGLVLLNSGPLPDRGDGGDFNALRNRSFPDAVTEIAVDQTTDAIHVLVSCQYGEADSGTVVARLVMHYTDGETAEFPITMGPDGVSDWHWNNANVKINEDTIGWEGTNDQGSAIRLSELIWQNPHPEKTIESIDFVSAKAAAALFLLGITLE